MQYTYKYTNNQLIPFVDKDGSRLEMHKSDYIYFGNSLRPRRNMLNDIEKCWYNDFENEVKIVIAAYEKTYGFSSENYIYEQYFKIQNDVDSFLVKSINKACEVVINK